MRVDDSCPEPAHLDIEERECGSENPAKNATEDSRNENEQIQVDERLDLKQNGCRTGELAENTSPCESTFVAEGRIEKLGCEC